MVEHWRRRARAAAVRARARALAAVRSRAGAAAAVTLGLVISAEVFSQSAYSSPIITPPLVGIVLFGATVYAALAGGVGAGLVSAAIAMVYIFGETSGADASPTTMILTGPQQAAVAVVAFSAMAVVVGGLREHVDRLLAGERDLRTHAEAAADRTARLQAVTAALSGALTSEQIAEVVITQGTAALGACAGALGLVRPDGTAVDLVRAVGYTRAIVEAYSHIPLTLASPMTDAIRSGEPVWIETHEALAARYPHLVPPEKRGEPMASLPLTLEGAARGVIVLSFRSPRTFSPEERAFMVALSQQCAQALERARLFEAERRARQTAEHSEGRIGRLQAVTAALSSALTPPEVASVIADVGIRALGGHAGAMALSFEDGEEFEGASFGYPDTLMRDWRTVCPEAVASLANAVRAGESVWVESKDDYLARYPEAAGVQAETGSAAFALVPLMAEGKTLGAMAVSFREPHAFCDDEKAFMGALAHQAAQALERARLFEAERRARAEAQRAADRVAHLQAVTAALSEAPTPEQVSAVILDRGVPALGAHAGAVVLLTDGGAAFETAGAVGYGPEVLGPWQRFPADTALPISDAVRTGRVVVVECPEVARSRYPSLAASGEVSGNRAWAAIPLVVDGRAIGAMTLSFAEPRAFAPEEQEFMTALGQHCAQALERARLFEAERRARAEAEAAAAAREVSLRALRDSEQRLQVALDAARMGTWAWEVSTGAVTWCPSLEEIHGLAPGAFGGTFQAFQRDIHPEDRPGVLETIDRALEAPGPYEVDYRIIRPDGAVRWLAARGRTERDGAGRPVRMAGVCMDVTDRKQVELDRADLLAREQAARAEAEAARQRLSFLVGASTDLASSLDTQATLERLAHLAVPTLADWCTVDVLQEDGSARRLVVAHADPSKEDLAREAQRRYPPDLQAEHHPVAQVLRTAQSILLPEVTDAHLAAAARDGDHLEMLRAVGLRSTMFVPLAAHGRVLGVVTFNTAESERRYGPADLALAEDLARRAALAIENAGLYERERRIAETLQRSLLPERLPEIPGVAVAARYLPGGAGVEVGGDWYDVIPLADGSIGLAMGDVVGRGIRAASVMGQLRNALRAYAMDGHPPGVVAERLDRLLKSLDENEMATLLYAVFDPATWTCRYVSAGHPPALVLSPDGTVRYLSAGRSVPLGIVRDAAYHEAAATLEPGSTLLLYTDGLVEKRGVPIDRGLEQLQRAAEGGPVEPEAFCDHVVRTMLTAEERSDDTALLALRPMPLLGAPLRLHLRARPTSLPLLRQTLRRWLGEAGVVFEEQFEVTVAVGEAAANAIEHAYGPGEATFEVEAGLEDEEIAVTIRDFGRWRAPRGQHRGRGLQVMRGLMDAVHVEQTLQGTEVRMRRRLRHKALA